MLITIHVHPFSVVGMPAKKTGVLFCLVTFKKHTKKLVFNSPASTPSAITEPLNSNSN